MPCYHPVDVRVKRKPFRPGGVRVLDEQTVPCGRCLGCRADQARQWSIRILHECQMHEAAWFATLTYEDERIPENGSLDPEDLRGFFKSLRREEPAGTVSYYACGEYGERTQRPHYHAVLFGPEFLDRRVLCDRGSSRVWRSSSLEAHWPYGMCELGTVTPASAAYVAGYVRKKVSRKVNPDHYTRVDPDTGELVELEPEFSRMSLRPAIGRRWIERYWKEVYPADRVVVQGFETKPPRYYDKWMDENHPRVMMEVRERRYEEAQDLSEYTLDSKERIHEARVGLFQRRDAV